MRGVAGGRGGVWERAARVVESSEAESRRESFMVDRNLGGEALRG